MLCLSYDWRRKAGSSDYFFLSLLKLEPTAPMNRVVGPDKAAGLEVYAGFVQIRKKIRLEMEINNVSSTHEVASMAIQLNKNAFGLSPASQQIICNPPIPIGGTGAAA